ncbi:MAG TPA: cold-shock protein [Deltaproteobacteria bacterium]|nr:cold-shock protein [Deltaproteobacteria bacterium]
MEEGTVKWFDERRGYGFITNDNGTDIFVHYSVIEMDGFKTLLEGQRVIYEANEGPRGPAAVMVSPA